MLRWTRFSRTQRELLHHILIFSCIISPPLHWWRPHVSFLSQIHQLPAPPTVPFSEWFITNPPTAQRLMSGPSSIPSGQAQVYLGEWSVIWGAFRHRYSQPPLGRLPMLQVSRPEEKQRRNIIDDGQVGLKLIYKTTIVCWRLWNKNIQNQHQHVLS